MRPEIFEQKVTKATKGEMLVWVPGASRDLLFGSSNVPRLGRWRRKQLESACPRGRLIPEPHAALFVPGLMSLSRLRHLPRVARRPRPSRSAELGR